MTRRSSRLRLAAALSAALLSTSLLAACGDNATEPAPLTANGQWADGVCGAYANLDTALGALGDPLPEPTGSIADRVLAAKDAVQGRVDTVNLAATGLTTAVNDLPADVDASLQTARDDVKTAVDEAQPVLDDAQAALDDAVANPSLASIGALATAATTLASEAGAAAQQGKDALSQAKGAAQAAFKEAPACQPFLTD